MAHHPHRHHPMVHHHHHHMEHRPLLHRLTARHPRHLMVHHRRHLMARLPRVTDRHLVIMDLWATITVEDLLILAVVMEEDLSAVITDPSVVIMDLLVVIMDLLVMITGLAEGDHSVTIMVVAAVVVLVLDRMDRLRDRMGLQRTINRKAYGKRNWYGSLNGNKFGKRSQN